VQTETLLQITELMSAEIDTDMVGFSALLFCVPLCLGLTAMPSDCPVVFFCLLSFLLLPSPPLRSFSV
jgi:hypothetical protein